VFFEFGVRTALNKPICLVKDTVTPAVPFDAGIINYHEYDPSLSGWSLAVEIPKMQTHIVDSSGKSGDTNSLWRLFGLSTAARPVEENDPLGAQLQFLLNEVSALSKRIGPEREGILVDASAVVNEHASMLFVAWSDYQIASDFLDAIWEMLRVRGADIPAYTYGKTWALRNSNTGELITNAGSAWALKHDQAGDVRHLLELGISPGTRLEAVRLDNGVRRSRRGDHRPTPTG
jgi:hypothetical protein